MSNKARPLGKIVIIQMAEKKAEKNLIIMPESSKNKEDVNLTILSTGPDCELGLKPGDVVMPRPGFLSAVMFLPDSKDKFMVPESFIIGVLNSEEGV